MSRMGQKRAKVNPGEITAIELADLPKLSVREEQFCVSFVATNDRHLSYQKAGYGAIKRNVQSAAITRLLKQPKIKARIEELTDQMLAAQGVTEERLVANLATMAFDKLAPRTDRIRATEILCKYKGMLNDTVNFNDIAQQRELDSQEAEECRQIALIRLRMQITGNTVEQEQSNGNDSKREAEGLQGQAESNAPGNESNAQGNGFSNGNAPKSNGNGESNARYQDDDAGGSGGECASQLRPAGLPVSALSECTNEREQDGLESRGL